MWFYSSVHVFESCSLSNVGGRLCYHIMYCSWLSTLVRVSVQPFGKFSHCSSMWTKTSVEFPITHRKKGLIRKFEIWLHLFVVIQCFVFQYFIYDRSYFLVKKIPKSKLHLTLFLNRFYRNLYTECCSFFCINTLFPS